MANTTAVYARIDTKLKENAEEILSQLGITPSCAIQMLYSQIVLTKGLPLDLHLPPANPTAVGSMSRAELDAELRKGVESIKEGKTFTTDEDYLKEHEDDEEIRQLIKKTINEANEDFKDMNKDSKKTLQ